MMAGNAIISHDYLCCCIVNLFLIYRMSTSFEGLFVSMELVPLFGAEFTVYAPIIVLIVGFLTLLNVYARILKVIGIESEDAVTGSCTTCHKLDADDIELIAVGKKLVTSQMHFVSGQARGSKSSTSVATSKQKIVKMSEFSEYTGDIENPLTIRNDGRVVGTSGADKTEVAGVVYSSVESVNEGLSKYEQDSRFGTDSDWGSTSSWSGQSGIDAGGWGKPSHVLLPMQGTGGRSAASLKASRNTASNVTAPERLASYAPTQALHKQADFSSNDSSGSSTIKSYGGRYKR